MRGDTSIAERAASYADKLAEERFNVVVFGEFKRGKSTFVNALLGVDVLPTAVIPLTSVVTSVASGPERVDVHFRDGRIEHAPLSTLASFVTERENPGNRRGVDHVAVSLPTSDLGDGVFLVDTPGVGSVHEHNTEAAYRFLPEADVAIFVTAADPPISAAERAFLESIRSDAARLFFVLNKIDYLSEGERTEAIGYTEEVLREAMDAPVRLYAMSARDALTARTAARLDELVASGLPAFERDFRRFLVEGKGAAMLESTARSALGLLQNERNSIDVEDHLLRLPTEEMERTVARMGDVIARAGTWRDRLRPLLQHQIEKILLELDDDLAEFRRGETSALLREAERFLRDREDVRQAATELDDHAKAVLRRRVTAWRSVQERKVAGHFEAIAERTTREANDIVQRTLELTAGILGIDLKAVPASRGVVAGSRFSAVIVEVPTLLESLLPDVSRMISPERAQRKALDRVRKRLPDWVDKYSGRLRWDFLQRLDASRRALEREIDERLDDAVSGLLLGSARASAERDRSERRAEDRAAVIARCRDDLERVERSIREVLDGLRSEARGTRAAVGSTP